MRCSGLLLLWPLLGGCIGVFTGRTPVTPYPITDADLAEDPPAALSSAPLPGRFATPHLVSIAPDPVAVTYTDRRHYDDALVVQQVVPTPFARGFLQAVGGSPRGATTVQVVIERLLQTCWPVRLGSYVAGRRLFVEAQIRLGDAAPERVRFTLYDADACHDLDDGLFFQGGEALAAEVVRLGSAP